MGLLESELQQLRDTTGEGYAVLYEQPPSISGTLAAIQSKRVPRATMDALAPHLGIRIGDQITNVIVKQVIERIKAFDKSLRAEFVPDESGNVTMVILGR